MSQYKEVANKLGIEGYKFELSNYISQGWKLGLQSLGWLILFAIIYLSISIVTQLIPIIGRFAQTFILAPVLSAGVTYFLHKKSTTGESDFSSFFDGFKNLGNLVVLNLLILLLFMVTMIPLLASMFSLLNMEFFQAIANEDRVAMEAIGRNIVSSAGGVGIGVGVFISVLLVCILMLSLVFAKQFVIIGELSAVEAIKASIQVAKKKIFPLFGFMIVLVLINILGLLPLGLGLIVTIPMSAGAVYFMFKDIVISQVNSGEIILSEDDILDA